MANGRIDDITDGAWLLLSSIALAVIFNRLLATLEELMYDGSKRANERRSRSLRIVHGVIMCVVGIAAATVSLPDDWVRSIVSSLGVGVGFALRDALSEALYGFQAGDLKSEFVAYASLDDALKSDRAAPKLRIVKEDTMSCVVRADDRTFTLPWSYLHKRVVERLPNSEV